MFHACVQVDAAKEELCGLGDGVEEIRSVCRQLQAQLRKVPDCADAACENEADTRMDRWLDVSSSRPQLSRKPPASLLPDPLHVESHPPDSTPFQSPDLLPSLT